MRPSGAFDTLGKSGTPNSLHHANPRPIMTVFAEGTFELVVPLQHKLSLHHQSSTSAAMGVTVLVLGAFVSFR